MDYAITAPYFDQVVIQLSDTYYSGKEIIIQSEKSSENSYYIESMSFNGEPLDKFFIDHHQLTKGGILKFEPVDEIADK